MKVTMAIYFDGMDEATHQEVKDAIVEGLDTACISVESIQIED